MKWLGRRYAASDITTDTADETAEQSKSTLDPDASEKGPRLKSRRDAKRKKRKKKHRQRSGKSFSPFSMCSTKFGPPPTTACETDLLLQATIGKTEARGGNAGDLQRSDREPAEGTDMQTLVGLAVGGDREATDQLCDMLANDPDLWRQLGDTGRLGLSRLIQTMAGSNKFACELVLCEVKSLWAELAGERPTGLVRIAANAVIAAALEMNLLNIMYPVAEKDWTVKQQTLLLRRRDSAQRRFAFAVKTYLLIKRIQPTLEELPPIAKRQSGPPTVADPERGRNGHLGLQTVGSNAKSENNGHRRNGHSRVSTDGGSDDGQSVRRRRKKAVSTATKNRVREYLPVLPLTAEADA